MERKVALPTTGLRARNDFRLARSPSRINAKRGDHFLQADFPLLIARCHTGLLRDCRPSRRSRTARESIRLSHLAVDGLN